MPSNSNLVKKTDYDTKIMTQEITHTDFHTTLKILDQKINSNKIEHLLVENELQKVKTFDSSYFRGKSHFEEDGTQNYLAFQPINRNFKMIANTKMFHHGNLKDYLMKLLRLLLHLIIVIFH